MLVRAMGSAVQAGGGVGSPRKARGTAGRVYRFNGWEGRWARARGAGSRPGAAPEVGGAGMEPKMLQPQRRAVPAGSRQCSQPRRRGHAGRHTRSRVPCAAAARCAQGSMGWLWAGGSGMGLWMAAGAPPGQAMEPSAAGGGCRGASWSMVGPAGLLPPRRARARHGVANAWLCPPS